MFSPSSTQCIYVGDTSRDAEAGFAAGCAMTITVRRDGGKDEDKLGADALIQGEKFPPLFASLTPLLTLLSSPHYSQIFPR